MAAGLLAATMTGIVFAQGGQAGQGSAPRVKVSGRWSNQVPVDSSCASL